MAGLTLVTAPTVDPVTLEEVKNHLRATDTTEDGLIAAYVKAATQHVENLIGRALIERAYDLKFDGSWPTDRFGAQRIQLDMPPLMAVDSISYVDTAGATQSLLSSDWQESEYLGVGVIVPTYGTTWPDTRNQPDAVIVSYRAGYGATALAVPDAIRQAILLLVGHWHANREAVAVGNAVNTVPFAVDALLSPYRISYP
jgi:uncharacterized phiE125 gp8 family phage protein